MSTALARLALAVASVAALGALVAGGPLAGPVFAAATVLIPVALIALGAARGGRLGGAQGWVLAALLVLLAGSLAGLFLVRGAGATVVLFVGVWLVPLVLVGVGYALTFDRRGLTEQDLERVRGVVGASDRALRDARLRPAPQCYGEGEEEGRR